MGKKGSKRKTRWRTLSIGAPPGEEDEEEGLRNGYAKSKENENGTHGYDRNEQTGYKPRRTGTGTSGTSGYASSGSRSRRDDTSGSPAQPKIIFNEDEYTRITTPRQDVLFKKGYLSRKKPWASNASTSATPSTTESQSASHSTADGSETTEDQQLLDRDSGTGEYPPVVEPAPQLGYGTFYDHASGYYYEYPVMLVGPTPIPAPVGPSVLAAVPCGPVPLRPIEWINPAFVPKLSGQSYCLMNYQDGQGMENTPPDDEQAPAPMPVEATNGICNESCVGCASCGESITGEVDEQNEETTAIKEEVNGDEQQEPQQQQNTEEDRQQQQYRPPPMEEMYTEEIQPVIEENGMNGGGYLEPVLLQQPVHVSHVMPAMPQPYMYPGHYMFGPPLVNVNGVTIQSGPMIRTTDVAAMAAACAKRRKKKKKKKQRRPTLGNTEDDEEEEYSSECDNGLLSSRLPWSVCQPPTTTASTTVNRPLNPECQEFQLRSVVETCASPIPTAASDDAATLGETSGTDPLYANASSSTPTESVTRGQDELSGSYSSVPTNPEESMENGEMDQETTEVPTMSENEINDRSCNDADRLKHQVPEDKEKIEEKGEEDVEKEGAKKDGDEKKEEKASTNRSAQLVNGAQTDNGTLPTTPRTTTEKIMNSSINANEICERLNSDVNGANRVSVKGHRKQQKEKILINGEVQKSNYNGKANARNDESLVDGTPKSIKKQAEDTRVEKSRCKSSTPKISTGSNATAAITVGNLQTDEAWQCESTRKSPVAPPRRKYSAKSSKFVRELTPGPDLADTTKLDGECETGKKVICEPNEQAECILLSDVPSLKRNIGDGTEGLVDTNERIETESSPEVCMESIEKGVVSDEIAEGSNEDSGIENQTQVPEYGITVAVTEWLRRANLPDVFISSTTSDSEETDEQEEVSVDEKPPKNLQGNPMPALSANSGADNEKLSCTTSCGEFARSNNIEKNEVVNNDTLAVSRRRKGARKTKEKSRERNGKRVRNVNERIQKSLQGERAGANVAPRKNLLARRDVDEVCEFTEKDSTAGMRVALSSRMDVNGVSARLKKSEKCSFHIMENIDVKMRRKGDADNANDEGIVEDTVTVKTFEKGEIVVSLDGKLLPVCSYEPLIRDNVQVLRNVETIKEVKVEEERSIRMEREGNCDTGKEDSNSVKMTSSLGSIEEPDVLECWEAETIEPVITPKHMLQSRGISYEGEAVEEDNFEADADNVDHVQKYYRLARESTVSIEEEPSEVRSTVNSYRSTNVPNSPEQMTESFCNEEISIVTPNLNQKENFEEQEKVPIDEAFEVYESCYTGKTPFLAIDSKFFKSKSLYGQEGEGPIPCKAVCCNIQ